jgi:putative transcriptional regulator
MNNQFPAKGKVLIAEPFLGDPNFERSVVLLCEHNESGSFGFVLNQTTQLTIKDVIEEEIYVPVPLQVGGPVEHNTLHFIHRLGSLVEDTLTVTDGLYWGGDFEQIKSLLNMGKITQQDVRFFIGYSGWGSGQLDNELKQNAWIVTDADANFIFTTPTDQLWRGILRRMDGKYKSIANYPTDPRLN